MGNVFLQEAALEKIMLRKLNNFCVKYCCESPSHATVVQPALCYVIPSQESFKASISQPLPPPSTLDGLIPDLQHATSQAHKMFEQLQAAFQM